ncbi:MAG: hypothetical protein WCO16_01130 [bacterium]
MVYIDSKGGDMPEKRTHILRYVALELTKLERQLTGKENEEMEEIRMELQLSHEEILAEGKKALVE